MAWFKRTPRPPGRRPKPSAYSFESLEPRLLLSADPLSAPVADLVPAGLDNSDPSDADVQNVLDALAGQADAYSGIDGPNDQSVSSGLEPLDLDLVGIPGDDSDAIRHEIVFVDANTPNHEDLISGIADSAGERELIVVMLDADRDGIAQISEALAGYQNLDAVHIVSHGGDGGFQLGDAWVDGESLDDYADQLRGWSGALTEQADLLIYGCNLAAGADGRGLVENLAALTGADVAASDDLTGQAALGGDWDLEYRAGVIESGLVFGGQSWHGVLATFTVNTTADTVDANPGDGLAEDASGNVSLRAAIMEANALAGADIIDLPSGTYTLSLTGSGEDAAASGDLDITSDITINGAGSTATIIDGNSADRIFDIRNTGDATISGVTIANGSEADGGAIRLIGGGGGGQLTLSESALRSNSATLKGGAIFNDGVLTVIDSEISANNSTADGGGLYNDQNATLTGVTLFGNTAAAGAGIYHGLGTGSLALTNVTLSGNTATDDGGGLHVIKSVDLTNVTVTGNSAPTGGGIFATGGLGDAVLKNTILADNTGGNANKALTDAGNNIDTDGTSGIAVTTLAALNLDPVLADNGGFTRTHALLVGSVAIDAGDDLSAPVNDQRGYSRSGTSDIGAYEFNGTPPAGNNDPVFTAFGPFSIAENSAVTTLVGDVDANDGDGGAADVGITYSIFANADPDGDFTDAVVIDSSTGEITVNDTGDFNFENASSFTITVRADDGVNTTDQVVTINVTDVNEAPTVALANTVTVVAENPATPLKVADIVVTDDALGTNNLSLSGADAGLFEIFGSELRIKSGAVVDFETNPVLDVTVEVDDPGVGGAPDDSDSLSITVTDVNEAPVLDNSGAAVLTVINENEFNNTGDLVSDIIASAGGDPITDDDAGAVEGIAVISVDDSNGRWEYSTNGGTAWTAFGAVSNSSAVVLGDSANDRIRFVPDVNYNGTALITYRAWDQSDTNPSGTTGVDASTFGGASPFSVATETAELTVTPVSLVLHVSTTTDVSSTGTPGLDAWSASELIAIGDPNIAFEPGTSNGTFSSLFDLDSFASSAINIDAVHTVSSNITVGGGGNTVDLLKEDVLFAIAENGVTFTGDDMVAVVVSKSDVVRFRPSDGTFEVVLDEVLNPSVGGMTLVEQSTTVGDVTLAQGSFLVNTGVDNDILYLTPTGAGQGVSPGTPVLLIAGNDIGVGGGANDIDAIDLVEDNISPGGTVLTAGQIILTLDADDFDVGDTNITVLANDVFYLDVTTTNLGMTGMTTATATLLFEGADINLNTSGERLSAISFDAEFGLQSVDPTITLPGGVVTYTEGDPPKLIDATATLIDPDSVDLESGQLSVNFAVGGTVDDRLAIRNVGTGAGEVGVAGNNVSFSGTTIGTFTGGNGTSPLVVTFNSNSTVLAVQAVMQNVTYENVSSDPSALSRTVRFVLTDGDGGTSNVETETINVIPVDQPPTLDLDADDSAGTGGNDYAFTFTEGDPATAIADADVDVADIDSTSFANVKLTIAGLLDGNFEEIVLDGDTFALATGITGQNTSGGLYTVSVTPGAGTADILITRQGGGSFSETEAETLIESIQYRHADSGNPTDGDRTVDVTVSDATSSSLAARTTINVDPVNDPATVSSASINVTETNVPVTASGTLTSTDVDNPDNVFTPSNTVGAIGTFDIDAAGAWTFTASSAFDNLNVGQNVNETFNVTSVDGTASTVTIQIDGSNDGAVVSSASINVTETNVPVTASGTLTSTDVDNPDNVFTPSNTVGAIGTFDIDAAGAWTFTASSAFDNLNVGQNVNETFNVTSVDGTASTVTIQIDGSNDGAVVSSASINVTETNVPVTASGTLTSTDVDNPDNVFTPSNTVGAIGTFDIDAAGAWTFTASSAFDNLNVGQNVNETFNVTSVDGTASTVTIQIDGSNDGAVVSSASINVTETNVPVTASGTLTSTDVDNPDNVFTPSNTVGAIGTFDIDAAGAWTFTANSAFDNLNVGQNVNETFNVTSVDGTASTVTIQIDGSNDGAVVSSASINVTETNVPVTASGTLTSTDVDNPDNVFTPSNTVGAIGTFDIDAAGAWTFTASSAFDNLNVGQNVNETFNVTSVDGTASTVTIQIDGSNDGAVVSSASINVTETNVPVTASGTLTSTDVDNPDNVFTPSNTVGAIGTFDIDAAGAWTFTASSAFDNLNVGQNVNETFNVTSVDGTASTVTIQIDGSNDGAVVSSASINVTETNVPVTASGTLTSTDVDNPDNVFTPSNTVGAIGTFDIDAAGAWTFTASSAFDNLNVGQNVNETFNVTSVDGTASTVTIQIDGSNDGAVVSSASINVTETNVPVTASGTLTSTDVDNPDNVFTPSNTVGAIGTFDIDAAGAWTFTANSAFDNLNVGQNVNETFNVTSVDGTASTVTIQIDGSNDGAVVSSASINVTETNVPVTASGTLTSTDVDNPDNVFTPSNTVGAIGTFDIDAAGAWTFTASSAFDNLNVGQNVNETFNVTSVDGTASTVTIQIDGSNDAPTLDLDANNSSGAGGNGNFFTFLAGDPVTAIADLDADLADADSAAFANVKLAIAGLLDGNLEEIVLDGNTFTLATGAAGQNTAGGLYTVSVTPGAGTADITITRQGGGNFSEAEAETLVKSIQYRHADGVSPSDGNRTVDVTVSDGALDSAAARATINVDPVNNPPVFTAFGPFSMAENPLAATAVGDVDANDGNSGLPDAGITYSVLSNADPDGDAVNAVFINAATGVISVNDVEDFDFENASSFTITVRADDGMKTTDQVVTVNVTDVDDVPPPDDDLLPGPGPITPPPIDPGPDPDPEPTAEDPPETEESGDGDESAESAAGGEGGAPVDPDVDPDVDGEALTADAGAEDGVQVAFDTGDRVVVTTTSLRLDPSSFLRAAFLRVPLTAVELGDFADNGFGAGPTAGQDRDSRDSDSVVHSQNFVRGLDSLREEKQNEVLIERVTVGSAIATSAGLSVGYVVWLIRSGLLMSSLLSSLPAWQFVDPLPVLARAGRRDDEDDESLESLVQTNNVRPAEHAGGRRLPPPLDLSLGQGTV